MQFSFGFPENLIELEISQTFQQMRLILVVVLSDHLVLFLHSIVVKSAAVELVSGHKKKLLFRQM